MEQTTQSTMQSSGSEKSQNGWKIATIAASVLAVVGFGLAIYGAVSVKEKVNDLKVVVENTDGTVTEIETPKVESTKEDGTVVTITDSAIVTENPEDYIYIGEWGIKIKIPDNLKEVSYIYNSMYDGSICFNGSQYDGQQYGPDFLYITKNPGGMGCLTRVSKSTDTEEYPWYAKTEAAVFDQGDYYWYYTSPQDVYSTEKSEQEWEVKSVELIKEMLSNSDNFSSI